MKQGLGLTVEATLCDTRRQAQMLNLDTSFRANTFMDRIILQDKHK